MCQQPSKPSLIKLVASVSLALPLAQTSVERTFSSFRYILNELKLALKENIFEAMMFQRGSTWDLSFAV